MSVPPELLVPDRTEDLPKGHRVCHRCGGKAQSLWMKAHTKLIIELCIEHVHEHGPGLLRGEWFRVFFNDNITEVEPPKRKARLVR